MLIRIEKKEELRKARLETEPGGFALEVKEPPKRRHDDQFLDRYCPRCKPPKSASSPRITNGAKNPGFLSDINPRTKTVPFKEQP